MVYDATTFFLMTFLTTLGGSATGTGSSTGSGSGVGCGSS